MNLSRLVSGLPHHGPLRMLAISSIINMAGAGVMTSTFAAYMSRYLGFSAGSIGWVLGLGSLVGVLLSLPAGRLVDRLGPWGPLWRGNFAFGVAMLAILCVRSPLLVTLAMMIGGAALCFNAPARSVYMVELSTGDNLVVARASMRSASQLGLAVGTLMGSLVFLGGNPLFFQVAIGLNGATSIYIALFIQRRLPRIHPHDDVGNGDAVRSKRAHQDVSYVIFTLVSSAFLMSGIAMDSALAVWMLHSHVAPMWLFPLLGVLAMLGTAAWQATLSRGSRDFASSSLRLFRAAVLVLVAMILLVVTVEARNRSAGVLRDFVGSVGLVASAVVFLIATLLAYGAAWSVSYGMRAKSRQGEYQGVDTTIHGALAVAAPPFIVPFVADGPVMNWAYLGGCFAFLGVCAAVQARWLSAHRSYSF